MNPVILFVVLLAALADAWQPGLRVRFDMDGTNGVDFFINLPKSVAEAEAEAWVLTERPAGPLPSLFMYCFPDRVVCALFDDTNYIAGLQISIPVEQWSGNVYDMEATGFTLWTPSVPFWLESQTYWSLQQYFVTEDILRQPKEVRLASRNSNKLIQHGAVWVTGVGKELVRIGDTTAEVHDSIFTEQACIPWMGQHYYYNMSSTTDCNVPLFPWFPMVDSGQLIATGFMVLGKLDRPNIARQWFETPVTAVVRAIVPSAPDCLFELTDNPGILTMHIYYVEEPWTIMC
ncbi:uncharacterized protein [Choristoneura fumiferana]|uniref:uncharacterized protein n=1 Tax=Choristoneura fumiferana TaxID=7141 RepID=UPI003D15748C